MTKSDYDAMGQVVHGLRGKPWLYVRPKLLKNQTHSKRRAEAALMLK